MTEAARAENKEFAGHWRKYPGYKPSGMEWLGNVPEGWLVHKLKYLASIKLSSVDKKVENEEKIVHLCNYVDVYKNDYITPRILFMEATASSDEINNFTIKKGDVLITKDSEEWDDIAVPAYVKFDIPNVLCGYHLALVRPNEKIIVGEYLFRSFQTHGINDQFRVAANGITRYGIGKFWIDSALFPVPSFREQHAIAAFLDRETARIDALIEKKERQIELLQEKRAALISHAVTKGLDPNAKMKDSGTEWLGMVPEGWGIISLKREWDVIDCKHITPEYTDDGIPIVSTTEVKPGRLSLENTRRTTEEGYRISIEGRCPKRGDILYSRNASLGSAAFVDTDEVFCMGQDVCLITSLSNDQLFLTYQLNSTIVLNQIDSQMIGSTIKRINVENINNLIVTYPPAREQRQIGSYLDKKIRKIDSIVGLIQRSIILGNEYRSTLISAAVTGKIDVRQEVIG